MHGKGAAVMNEFSRRLGYQEYRVRIVVCARNSYSSRVNVIGDLIDYSRLGLIRSVGKFIS